MVEWHAIILGYVDPGAGGHLFQLLIAGVMAGVFTLTNLKTKVMVTVRRLFSRKTPESNSGTKPGSPM